MALIKKLLIGVGLCIGTGSIAFGQSYYLTVTDGSGSGTYTSGQNVSITANSAPSGYAFSGWNSLNGGFANANASTTTVTMPAANYTVTALYSASGGTTYPLTVNGGTGSGNYPAGAVVNIVANQAPSGQQFVRWLGAANSSLVLGNADNPNTSFTMSAETATFTASYGAIAPTYAVTVTNGTGGGSYTAGTVLAVTANAPANGSAFTGWTGGTSALANAAFSTTTLTVPSAPITVTANFAATTATATLTVNGGTGSGTYTPGTAVAVTAAAPATGQVFSGWTGSTGQLASAASPTTTLFTTSSAATITASYSPISATGTLILAVGLERLVPTYNGPAIRIQRPSDNTQTDIGFATGSNQLNNAAISSFLGSSQGWITTLYAQDGSGHNVTTPLPTSTSTMPTISALDPTSIVINGTTNLTARNVEQPYQGGQGNLRYFVIPPSVVINKAQASAFLALRVDWSGSASGDPFMSLYEVGNPTIDAFDIYSTGGGFQGLTHNSTVDFSSTSIFSRSQPTVIGLVTAPGTTPAIYLDGTAHAATTDFGNTIDPVSANCSGGYLIAGSGTGLYYGVPFWGNYNFLGFELYSGTATAATASTISTAMLPRTVPTVNIVADGDSITQGTGGIYGYNMLHFLEPLLNSPADITNMAIYGTTSPSAVGHATSPTTSTSAVGMLYRPGAKNIYYVDIGTNDIHGNFLDGNGTWAEVQQALQAAKSLGYTTVVTTVMHELNETATQAASVNTFNTDARAAVGSSYLDAIIDYTADERLGNPGIYYPTYTGDGTHPNDVGYQIMANIAAPVINGFITPAPAPTLVSAASQQVQGGAGTFKLSLALTGKPTIEPRRGSTVGSYSLVLTFSQPVTSLSANLQLQSGASGSIVGSAGSPTISGNTVTVPLTSVGDAQLLDLHLTNIQPGGGTADVPFDVLVGDLNGDGIVNNTDYLISRTVLNATVTTANFTDDVNCDGQINSTDELLVRSLLNTYLP